MSDHTTSDFFAEANYLQQHVGGKHRSHNNQQYIDNQLRLIKDGDKYLPPNVRHGATTHQFGKFNQFDTQMQQTQNANSINSSPYMKQLNTNTEQFVSDGTKNNGGRFRNVYGREDHIRYDPYDGFLFKKGLMDDGTNRRRFRTIYINIDSRFRIIDPSATVDDATILNVDPLNFTANSATVFVNHPNHPFTIGDLIQITNVVGKNAILRTFNDNDQATLDIQAGCNVMKVFYRHEIGLDYNGDTLEVDLSDIKGDRGSVETASYLGNIPTNVLNTRHKIVINVDTTTLNLNCDPENLPDGYFDPSPLYFFVILPITMRIPVEGLPYILGKFNFRLKILATGGVPVNFINARYPVDPEHAQGYHIIRSTQENGYTIDLPVLSLFSEISGGKCVTINKIETVESGYPNQNSYTIDLGKAYHNIISARMVSCEFPNSDTAIRDFPEERANNRIYWNDIDDGDFLYSIAVPPGNYTPGELATVMESLFLQVPRVNANTQDFTFEDNHFIRVRVNNNTNKVTFESFKEFCLIQPIIEVTPEISTTPDSANQLEEAQATYTLTINHPGHGMVTPGTNILMQRTIPHFGIPADTLNTTHTVTEIVDENTYKFELPSCAFNLSRTRTDTRGGNAVRIYIPDLFRLRFDQPDTLGGLLGFRNPGNSNSVYAFANSISNSDSYQYETSTNALGEVVDISNNFIRLSGDDYVMMIAEPLQTLTNIGPNKFVFAKIQLCDSPGKVLFNTHVSTTRFYEDPIHEVSELQINFYGPSGFLYDFNGLEHSFTLELVTVSDIPEGTGINSNTGRNYNLVV